MANGQQLESGSPAGEAFYQLFEELNAQVDAAGNRSLAKVLENHPFPIYEATVRQSRMLKERRTDVGEFTVKLGGAVGEVLVGGFDLVWDVATAPVHLTFYPKLRHPLYKAVLARFASFVDENEKINYTERVTAIPRPEGERPHIADLPVSQTDAIPPPPEGIPPVQVEPVVSPEPASKVRSSADLNPPKTPDTEQKSEEVKNNLPQREAFHRLMRDIFEVTEPALREDVRDRVETTAALGERTAQAWQEFTRTPWNIPRHVRQFDTALRGRDLGSLKMRLGRILVYNTVRAITARVDILDDVAKIPLKTIPAGGYISKGVEFLSDELIRAGTEWTVQQATQIRQARFSSPIAITANRVLNIVPFLGWDTNAPGLETRMRNAYNLPIAGVPIEHLYAAANRWITQIERNPHGQLMERFVFAVLGGSHLEESFRQERERTGVPPPAPIATGS